MTITAIKRPQEFEAFPFDKDALPRMASRMGATKVAVVTDYASGIVEYAFGRKDRTILTFTPKPGDELMVLLGPRDSVSIVTLETWVRDYQVVNPPETTYTDDHTLDKVRNTLSAQGFAPDQVTDAISELQNVGILFRERADA